MQCCKPILNNLSLLLVCILGLSLVMAIMVTIQRIISNRPYVSIFQTSLSIKSNSYNDIKKIKLNYKPFLKNIRIDNHCFSRVAEFHINGMKSLRTLSIGSNSFTEKKNEYGSDNSKSFHILNCMKLESIGEYSFSDYGGEFELKNLPLLQSINIGETRRESSNFYCSTFVIRGILNDIENVMIRSS